MPALAIEVFGRKGSRGSKRRREFRYIVKDAANQEEAEDAIQAASPSTVDGLVLLDIDDVEEVPGTSWWEGRKIFGPPASVTVAPPETGDSVVSFDTTGRTTHITQSISSVRTYHASGSAAGSPFKGAINVSSDGSGIRVGGTDIVIPVFRFPLTVYVDAEDVDSTYIGRCYRQTGTYNNSDINIEINGFVFPFLAGELLLEGVIGSQRGVGDWEINFYISGSPNASLDEGTEIEIEGLAPIEKLGWQYLWVFYEDWEDTTNHIVVKKPKWGIVEEVYPSSEFTNLNIAAS